MEDTALLQQLVDEEEDEEDIKRVGNKSELSHLLLEAV